MKLKNEINNKPFKHVWLVDFEFSAPPGENPKPICLVAWDLVSGQKMRIWQDELNTLKMPPYDISSESLFVAYYASAEMGCHLSLNWGLPENVLDLFTEFRAKTNGNPPSCGSGLLGALIWHGIDAMDSTEKDSMRELAIRGGPFSQEERKDLINYCEADVEALSKLLPTMLPETDIDRALLRGRYMKAAAKIEHNGIPIDTDTLHLLKEQWELLPQQLIALIDNDYGVFEEQTFKYDLFAKYLIANDIPWPRLASGKLDLKDETFRERAKSYPQLNALRELRLSLSQLRLSNLAIGSDDRNRCLLSPFRSRTGRNQPSNSKFIFGPSVWLRSLIKPKPNTGIAYIDWSQQEFGIAAALSNDLKMMEAYRSGDPYLAFAKQAGAVPEHATKSSHKAQRDQFKACVLAVQYGMGPDSLAARINQPIAKAKQLLQLHRETYRTFWAWSDAAVDYAMLHNKLWTVFGWTIHTDNNPNPRFLRNFLMQGNGAEMLRLACCMLIESGIKVCAPIHDAVLIESSLDSLDNDIKKAQQLMEEASAAILNGFTLRSDVEVVRSPNRYLDERGKNMWEKVSEILEMNKSYTEFNNA